MSNRLFNGEALLGGVPGQNEAGQGSPRPDRVGGGLYTSLLGMVRLMDGVRIGRQARRRGLTGPSTWLGRGGFSWRSVLSLVPGIWEAPSVRDFPRRRGWEGGMGAAHHSRDLALCI